MPGLGGMPAAGGRTGSGGVVGAGGRAAGGATGTGGAPGTGGATDGGAADRPGAGGMVGAGGAAGMDAGTDADSGMVGGTGPCAGICSPAVSFSQPPNYGSPQLGLGAACFETLSTVNGGGCSNCSGRTMTLNGTPEPTTGGNWPGPIPPRVNGGYCVQISAGDVAFATFYTF